MSDKDINNLKEMLVDFNEYSTDYTKTRCRELEETIENTLKEIERLNKITNEFDKWLENEIKFQEIVENAHFLRKARIKLRELKGEKE